MTSIFEPPAHTYIFTPGYGDPVTITGGKDVFVRVMTDKRLVRIDVPEGKIVTLVPIKSYRVQLAKRAKSLVKAA